MGVVKAASCTCRYPVVILKAGPRQKSKITTAGATIPAGHGGKHHSTRRRASRHTQTSSGLVHMGCNTAVTSITIRKEQCGLLQRMDVRASHLPGCRCASVLSSKHASFMSCSLLLLL